MVQIGCMVCEIVPKLRLPKSQGDSNGSVDYEAKNELECDSLSSPGTSAWSSPYLQDI